MRKRLFISLTIISLCGGCAVAQKPAAKQKPVLDSSSVATAKPMAPIDSVVLPRPRTSPVAVAFYKTPNNYIKVVYGQPYKRGREVFGVMEPYGQVWRTGANEATEITFTKDVRFGGKPLKAGTYTLFTIPNKDKWTVILNSDLGQWGAFGYDASKNVVTLDTPIAALREMYEAFTIKFEDAKGGANLCLLWDRTRVAVPLVFGK